MNKPFCERYIESENERRKRKSATTRQMSMAFIFVVVMSFRLAIYWGCCNGYLSNSK